MTNKRNLLKKGFIMFLVVLMALVAIPQKGEAAYSTITSSKNVNYSMDIVKSDIKYNVFKNAPYNLPNSTLVSDSINFIGSKYQAVKEVVTDNSRTWVNFKDLNGTEIGWVDKNAVKQGANFRTVTASKVVNYSMEIVPTEITYNVYSNGPHNTPNSALVNNSSAYFKQSFRAVKEVETDSERTWVNFVDSTGKDMGWIDLNAVQSNEKMTKPVVTSHKLTSNTGYLNLKWEPRANAISYKVGFFNGYNYQYIDVGNVNSWSTQGKRIWATGADLGKGDYLLRFNGTGNELPMDPMRTYAAAYKKNPTTNYSDRLFYYTRVIAVYANGESPTSDASTVTMPLSSITGSEVEANGIDDAKGSLDLYWEPQSNVSGYKVWIFDGKNYIPFDVENEVEWHSQFRNIWPSKEQIQGGKSDILLDDSGTELSKTPSDLYKAKGSSYTTDEYYTRVTAYDQNGDTVAYYNNLKIDIPDAPVDSLEAEKEIEELSERIGEYINRSEDDGTTFDLKKAESDAVSAEDIEIGMLINDFNAENNVPMDESNTVKSLSRGIKVWGNWCGPKHGSGKPVDKLDAACKEHDLCYGKRGYFACSCDIQLVKNIKRNSSKMKSKEKKAAFAVVLWFQNSLCNPFK
ncbi:GW dipeptide domain-containing protein [Paenilisteria newyorkensis]|uniref:GW dipeptide domain-containing protein n=1 Tax=Listeria newyorkensis TaxID=1497681 RepID=UPI000669B4D8|nr:GW dipeptide domain-containing protein [Listeria newyorkensis]KMT62890.1 wall-associated protein [Listeria newyorkensis]